VKQKEVLFYRVKILLLRQYITEKKNILNSVLTRIFYTRVHRTRKKAKRGSDHEGEKQFSIDTDTVNSTLTQGLS